MSASTSGRPRARTNAAREIAIPVGPGEFFDRFSVLRLKCERFRDAAQRRHVERQRRTLADLEQRLEIDTDRSVRLRPLVSQLYRVNGALWDLEAGLRQCEATGDFGPTFVEMSRSIYALNDERSALKAAIDAVFGCPPHDPKEYATT